MPLFRSLKFGSSTSKIIAEEIIEDANDIQDIEHDSNLIKSTTNSKQLKTGMNNNSWNKSVGVSKKSSLGALVKTKVNVAKTDVKENIVKDISVKPEMKTNALSLLGTYSDSDENSN